MAKLNRIKIEKINQPIIELDIEKKTNIPIYKHEKKGIIWVMILYAISWGLMITPYPAMRFIGWVTLGMIGFSLWRIIDGLLERGTY